MKRLWLWLRGWRKLPEAEVEEAKAEARLRIAKAIRRANYLHDKAGRLPSNSNGHKKAKRDAAMIAQGAYDLAERTGLTREFFRG